ncbi:MAG: acyltransferase [Flavobacteriaceae bacterium]|nr:acyltransferase [Flavobacteriaceae bacterium]
MGGIRTILALIVVINHSEPVFGLKFLGNELAVQTFYIISGFYMALILNEKYIGINKSYKLFITNRLLRLYPIYWSVLACIIGISLFYGIYSGGEKFGFLNKFIAEGHHLNPMNLIFVIFSNLTIVFQDVLLFMEVNQTTGSFFFQPNFDHNQLNGFDFLLIPQAWTVALEIIFYLIAPFIVRRKTAIILAIFLLFVGIRLVTFYGLELTNAPWNFRFFPNEMVFFLLGVLAYKYYKFEGIQLSQTHYLKAIYGAVLLLIFGYDFLRFDSSHLIFALLFSLALPYLFSLFKDAKIDRYIGELSYPIYICHMFVISVMNELDYYFFGSKVFTVIVISIGFSIILKHLVSDKVERYRQKRVQ